MAAADRRAFVITMALGAMLHAGLARGGTILIYGTAAGQQGPAYPGGVIVEGDTVRIDDGATVTGTISNSGTLQFN